MESAAAKKWSWRDEPELMDELTAIQNSGGKFDHIDIMTIVGFMRSREELVKHVEANRA